MSEESFNHLQAFQQAIATTLTCRTLIKYNSNLNIEQKEEILHEIETTLAFLHKRLEVNASIEASTVLSPERLADLLITDAGIVDNEMLLGAEEPAPPQAEPEMSLRHLHQLYNTYFGTETDKGMATLETNYKSVMATLDQVQALAELRHNVTSSELTVDGLLVRVRSFVTALYCMFREFAALLAKAFEGQNIDVDTEAMVLPRESFDETAQQFVYNITPLITVYNQQQRIQQSKGPFCENTRDATAFLIFLQECLGQTCARRQEMVSQINSTASLLHELTSLLTDYELAVTQVMQSLSRSQE